MTMTRYLSEGTLKRMGDFSSVYLRLALGVSFLSAVGDRFGFWGAFGQPHVTWGDFSHFIAYTAKLNWFMPSATIPALAWASTCAEFLLGVALVLGVFTRVAAFLSGLLLLLFAVVMAFALSLQAPLSFSVFSASAGAFLLATCGEYSWSLDSLRRPQKTGTLQVERIHRSKAMKAVRVHKFGGPDVLVIDELPTPSPGPGELLVRVAADGVGPWDALIREGKSKVSPPLPLTLGSDLSGVVEAVGTGVVEFKVGDQVYGVTNSQFCGAYAEYALASAAMIAQKPQRLTHIEAASAPVVGVTAWQMLFDYAQVVAGQRILILGAAGNVGAYVVQLAARAGLDVIGTASSKDTEYVRSLGAETVVDFKAGRFEDSVAPVDAVIDTVGGDTRDRSFRVLKPGGILVSVVSTDSLPKRSDVRAVFFYVDVTTARLDNIGRLFERGDLVTHVGTVLPLEKARTAHEMLAGAPHKRGKLVLSVSDGLSAS